MAKDERLPAGYVMVEREGDLIRTGSRIERETRHGERILVGVDAEETCSWVRKFRGTIRYSSPQQNRDVLKSIDDKIEGRYVPMIADTYAEGVHALREACEEDTNSPHPVFVEDDGSRIYRPLTFRENLAARLQDHSLFKSLLFSCTGIAYKKDSTKFKIVPRCKELITIPRGYDQPYLEIDYDEFDYEEFDSSKIRYSELQTRKETKQDQLWLAAAGGDKDLLSGNVDHVFDWLEKHDVDKGMAFIVRESSSTKYDQVRALFVNDLGAHSNANGRSSLNSGGSFLRVSPI